MLVRVRDLACIVSVNIILIVKKHIKLFINLQIKIPNLWFFRDLIYQYCTSSVDSFVFSFAFFSNPLILLDDVRTSYDHQKKIGLHFFKNVLRPKNPRWRPMYKISKKQGMRYFKMNFLFNKASKNIK